MSIDPPARPTTRRRALGLLLAPLTLLAIPACGEPDKPARFARRAVPISEVPEPVMTAAKKALPGVNFDESWKNLDAENQLLSFEIRGRSANGKIREVRVGPDGAIIEME
jgi:hypothetical protein